MRIAAVHESLLGTTLTISLMQQRWSGIWGSTAVPAKSLRHPLQWPILMIC